MDTAVAQDDPMLRLRYYRETGQDAEAAGYEKYLRSTGQWKDEGLTPGHSKLSPRELVGNANRAVTDAEVEQALEPNTATKILGTAAAALRDIPGAEAAQARIASIVSRRPYRETLRDIRGVEDAAGAPAEIARLGGAGLAMAALPGSATLQGARYGILSGLLDADPDKDLRARVWDATAKGAVGAAGGRLISGAANKISRIPAVIRATKAGVRAMLPAGEAAATEATESAGPRSLLELVKSGAPESAAQSPARSEVVARGEQAFQDALREGAASAEAAPSAEDELMRRLTESIKATREAKNLRATPLRPRSVSDVRRGR